MLIYIYDGFCHLYDLRFQKSFGENFSFQVQGHSRSNMQNSMKLMFIGLFQLILSLALICIVGPQGVKGTVL